MNWIIKISLLILAYLIGSIPWGFLFGKMKGIDIREHGSKNIGATNTGRVLGRRYAILAYILDSIKGALFVSLFTTGTISMDYCLVSPVFYGIAAVLGHTFPIYLNFRGGKAVATGGGVLLAYCPILFLISVAVFFVVTTVFKYVSLGSLLAALTAAFGVIYLVVFVKDIYDGYFLVGTLFIVLVIFVRHSGNIKRIIHKEEAKVKWRKNKQ